MTPAVARKNGSFKHAPSRSDSTSTVDSSTSRTTTPAGFEYNAMKRQLFKTKMCRHFLSGKCKYNDDCTFSHDRGELLIRKDMAKTKLCKKPACVDPACAYAHSIVEIRDATDKMCPEWMKMGSCANGATCRLSHNMTYLEELAVASTNPKEVPPVRVTTPTVETPSEASATDLVEALIQLLSSAQTYEPRY